MGGGVNLQEYAACHALGHGLGWHAVKLDMVDDTEPNAKQQGEKVLYDAGKAGDQSAVNQALDDNSLRTIATSV